MRRTHYVVFLTVAAALAAAAADDTAGRLENAAAVFNTLTKSGHDIRPEQIGNADCIAVIPGFKKGAAVVGVGYGRGFISCRNDGNWSAPAAITLESASLGVQLGGEEVDIVILSLDRERRLKLLSDRFAIGSDASAAWGNGKSAHGDTNTTLLFFGRTKGTFAGFSLDGATLKSDQSSDKALYSKKLTNHAIVEGGVPVPGVAEPFIVALTQAFK